LPDNHQKYKSLWTEKTSGKTKKYSAIYNDTIRQSSNANNAQDTSKYNANTT